MRTIQKLHQFALIYVSDINQLNIMSLVGLQSLHSFPTQIHIFFLRCSLFSYDGFIIVSYCSQLASFYFPFSTYQIYENVWNVCKISGLFSFPSAFSVFTLSTIWNPQTLMDHHLQMKIHHCLLSSFHLHAFSSAFFFLVL